MSAGCGGGGRTGEVSAVGPVHSVSYARFLARSEDGVEAVGEAELGLGRSGNFAVSWRMLCRSACLVDCASEDSVTNRSARWKGIARIAR